MRVKVMLIREIWRLEIVLGWLVRERDFLKSELSISHLSDSQSTRFRCHQLERIHPNDPIPHNVQCYCSPLHMTIGCGLKADGDRAYSHCQSWLAKITGFHSGGEEIMRY